MEKSQRSSCLKKKNNKQELKNYRPISLLPASGKMFEMLLYGSVSFTENNLIRQNQSGFKSGDFCTNQLLWITDQIYECFDEGHEVRSVFLGVSKAFDKVWHKVWRKVRHESLIFKLK